jgi:hypothetical protein
LCTYKYSTKNYNTILEIYIYSQYLELPMDPVPVDGATAGVSFWWKYLGSAAVYVIGVCSWW